MPTLRRKRGRHGRREEYSLVYRPDGTLYAQGRAVELEAAMQRAWYNFVAEYGRMPVQEQVVAEVIGITAGWDVTVFELPEEAR
jgi:hypothetical protein